MPLESLRIQFIFSLSLSPSRSLALSLSLSLSLVYLEHEAQFPRMSSRKIIHKTVS